MVSLLVAFAALFAAVFFLRRMLDTLKWLAVALVVGFGVPGVVILVLLFVARFVGAH